MAWLDSIRDKKTRDRIPERLRDKSPEDIAKELESAEQLRKDLDAEKTARSKSEEALKSIQTDVEKVKAQLAVAEATRQAPPKDPPTKEEPIDFNLDPEGALRQRIKPVVETTVLNTAMTARILAQQQLNNADAMNKTMDGRLFQAWADDIDAESKKYQAIQLTSPQAWLGIFYYIKGIRADELRDPETRKKKYGYLEPAQTQSHEPEPKSKKDELTDEEKRVADKMGVSHENYLKRKKSMQFVNV